MAWDGEKGLERRLVVNTVVLEVDVAVHDGGDEGDCVQEIVVVCHVPYFLGPSPSFSGLPVTFPPVPDPFPCVL